MRRLFGRLLFAAFMVGQLQLIPAAMACVREHRQPEPAAHCATHQMMADGPAVAPAQGAMGGLCAMLGPCAHPAPIVVPARVVVASADFVRRPVPSLPVQRPDSITLAPLAPPPQA